MSNRPARHTVGMQTRPEPEFPVRPPAPDKEPRATRRIAVGIVVIVVLAFVGLIAAGVTGKLGGSTPSAKGGSGSASGAVSGAAGGGTGAGSAAGGGGAGVAGGPAAGSSGVRVKAGPPVALSKRFAYTDGLAVKISSVRRVPRDKVAAGGSAADIVMQVDVTIINGTKGIFDPSLAVVTLTYGTGHTKAQTVFQSGIDPFAQGTLPPGRGVSGTFGFAVPKSAGKKVPVDVAVTPAPDHGASGFIGTV